MLSVFLISSIGLLVSQYVPKANVVGLLALKRKDFIHVAQDSEAGSFVMIPEFSSAWEFILYAPGAAFRTLFRPGLWEIRSAIDGIASVENAGYMLLIVLAIRYKKRFETDLLMAILCFVIPLSVLIGSVTPVLGAIVRYKTPLLPFLVIGIFALIDTERLPKLGFKR